MGCAATAKGFNVEGTERRVGMAFRKCRREVPGAGKRQEGIRGRVAREGRCVGGKTCCVRWQAVGLGEAGCVADRVGFRLCGFCPFVL